MLSQSLWTLVSGKNRKVIGRTIIPLGSISALKNIDPVTLTSDKDVEDICTFLKFSRVSRYDNSSV